MKRPIEAVIEKVSLKPNKIQPIIVDFQNGTLKDEEASHIDCGVYRDDKSNKQLLALSNGHVVYKGYRPEPDEAPTYTMLAIHNKRTGKVRLIQAEKWKVGPVLDKQLETNGSLDEDRIAQLNKQFGSKRVKRRTEQVERTKVNVDSVKNQLEKTVSKIKIDRTDLTLPSLKDEAVANTNLPTCNRDASRVEDVYDVNDIVPRSKLETLLEGCEMVVTKELEGKSKFFVETLEQLKSSENLEHIALLLYLDAVASWLNMPMKDAKKRMSNVCPYSKEINDYVIETYSMLSAQGRLRPNSMKDKGTVHCLILGLMIHNYTLDLNLFATNNRIGIKKLGEMARLIGAVPHKDKKNTFVLKLPLPPQLVIAKQGGKKGGRKSK